MPFSVAMCTFDGARFVEAQLESLAAQRRLPDELVICDDRSTDETPRIVERFAAGAPFPVRFEMNPERLGTSRNFERAISLCRGDLIALSDQDDVWRPEKLERFEAAFARDDEIGLVLSNAEIVGEDLEPLGYDLWTWSRFRFPGGDPAILPRGFHTVLMRGVAFGIAMAFRARHRDWILPIPAHRAVFNSWLPLHDKWVAMLLAAVSRVAMVEQSLTLYRQHHGQQTGASLIPRAVSRDASVFQPPKREVFATAAESHAELRAKILSNPRHRLDAGELEELSALIDHLETRAAMPGNRLARLPRVVRELGSGGYARFGNGWRSALRDLM